MRNQEIAEIFRGIAQLLEIKGDNPFRVRAYERAAQNIEGLNEDIETLSQQDRLTQVSGIGKDLEDKIKEIVRTGKLKFYIRLKKTLPAGLLDLLNIPSVGPRTAKLLYEKLKIKSVSDLERAIEKGKLSGLFGIKDKTIQNILVGIELLKKKRERLTLQEATQVADEFIAHLKKVPEAKQISPAGSLRRQKETVRDIDILVVSDKPQKVMDAFVDSPSVKQVLAKGPTKSSLRTRADVQVDCRVVEERSFGAALIYFTGSKNFNIKLRQLAQRRGLKVNEYGLFKKEKFLAGRNEKELFGALGMVYIEPELREDSGEIELAQKAALPHLIELSDIKGELHAHSSWSDGSNTIKEMADAAKLLGYSYIAITDHSQSLKIAGGLSIADLKKKKREIEKINRGLKNFRVLYSSEVDIDSDGNLDYPQRILQEFDLVVAAIHSGFKQSKQQITRRLIRACQNKYAHIIAHPTGRLWGVRQAYELNWDEFLKVAADTKTSLEINAFPQRLDLDSHDCRRAKEAGVSLSLGTDAHLSEQLGMMRLGVSVARRGWLTKEDVINTLGVDELLRKIKK